MSIPFLNISQPTLQPRHTHHPHLFATEPSMEPSICLSFTTGRNHHHHRVHSSSTCLQRGVARANRHVLGKAKRGKRAKVTVSKPSTRQRSGSTLSQGIEPNSPAATVLSWSERFRSVRDLRGGCCKPDTKEFETVWSRLMIPFFCSLELRWFEGQVKIYQKPIIAH